MKLKTWTLNKFTSCKLKTKKEIESDKLKVLAKTEITKFSSWKGLREAPNEYLTRKNIELKAVLEK